YADYPMQFADFNAVVSVAAFVFGLAQAWFALFIVLPMLRKRGLPAPARPWEGAQGLEWTLPTPLPAHTFETPPDLRDHRMP
ncbi:MAG: cytochrome c oxidase subunit I, partial [Aquabacterium sp.]